MRYIMRYCYLLLLLLGMVACSKEKVDTPDDGDGSNGLRLNLTIQTSQQDTSRTPVVEPDDDKLGAKHHVSWIRLFLIDDDESSSNYQEILLEKTFKWEQYASNPGGQSTGYDTESMSVDIDWNEISGLQAKSKLRVIAIGLDATGENDGVLSGNSADAYSCVGKFFSNVAWGIPTVTDEDGNQINPIPRSEFYAGCSTSFTPSDLTGIGQSDIKVSLYRRVAGFVAYFKNIPEEVKYIGIGSGHKHNYFQISLPILSAVQLGITDEKILDKHWEGAKDGYLPIEPALSDDLIFVLVNAEGQSARTRNGSGTTVGPSNNPDPELIDNGKIMGFMPPMTIDVADYRDNASTLMLNLYGKEHTVETSWGPTVVYPLLKSVKIFLESSVYPAGATRAGTGIIVEEADRDPNYQYHIRANEIYRIGSVDYPVSLDGSVSDVTLQIDHVWDEYYGGSMEDNAQGGIGIDTEWGDRPAGEIGSSSNDN